MGNAITLGGRRFDLRPLKLGQLRHLLDALDEMAGKTAGGLIEAAAKVVATGLAASHPGLTHEAILDLEAGVEELNAAVAAILAAAGLKPQEPALGEARPVANPEGAAPSGSARSMPPSPPAAATPIASSTT
jgi:hypothetical protein